MYCTLSYTQHYNVLVDYRERALTAVTQRYMTQIGVTMTYSILAL